jgi:hypothetical protein
MGWGMDGQVGGKVSMDADVEDTSRWNGRIYDWMNS